MKVNSKHKGGHISLVIAVLEYNEYFQLSVMTDRYFPIFL